MIALPKAELQHLDPIINAVPTISIPDYSDTLSKPFRLHINEIRHEKYITFAFPELIYIAQKWGFPLRISSVNVSKETADLVTFTEETLMESFFFGQC